MTAIIMLPPPTPQHLRPAGPDAGTRPGGGERDFASALHAVVDHDAASVAAGAEATAGSSGTPGCSGTPGTPEVPGAPGTEMPTTVAQIVQSAAELLAGVAGLSAASSSSPSASSSADVTAGGAGDDATGELAQVIDLSARRAAHAARDGVVVSQQGSAVPTQQDGSGLRAVASAATAADVPAAAPGVGTGPTIAGAPAGAGPTGAVSSGATAARPQDADTGASAQQTQSATVTGQTGASTGITPAQSTSPTGGAAAAPAPSSAPSEPARPLAEQLGVRLAALRGAGAGEHVLTLRVDPDSIGPVRVVAHIGAEGVRIELLGATDQAREALKAALPDLRRDLVAAGLPADLGLGNGRGSSLPGQGTGVGGQGTGADGQGPGRDAKAGAGPNLDRQPTDSRATHSPTSDRLVGLDLLA